MASNKPVIHAQDHRRIGALGPNDPGGADPIDLMLPTGIIAGYGSVDLAVRNPGNLLWYYTMGDASPGPLLDTSHFDGTPRNLTYYNSGIVLGGTLYPTGSDAAGWSSANEADFQVMDHTSFGSGDDGSVFFPYDQPAPSPDNGYPGVFFEGTNSLMNWSTTGDNLRSISGWLKIPSGATAHTSYLWGSYQNASTHNNGWAPWVNNGTRTLNFAGRLSSGSDLLITAPGTLLADQWYHLAITWDGAVYLMYLNGVVVSSVNETHAIGGSSNMYVGGFWTSDGFFDGIMAFFHGGIDQLSGYSITLTSDQVQAIYAGRGAGTSTSIETVTIGAGASGTIGAVSSTVAGVDAPAGEMLVSDGSGGTAFDYPSFDVLVDGV